MNDLVTGSVLANEGVVQVPPEGVCRIDMVVDDALIVTEMLAYPMGPERDRYVLTALRIGVLALKQAQGRLDADVIRGESDRLLALLEDRLGNHQRNVQDQVAGTLREYFDPRSGRFNERVEQLVKSGGDLERLLRTQIGASDSELAKTLAAHVGEQSMLMKILRPSETEGILNSLSQVMHKALETQRNAILSEFSLDEQDSALARMKVALEQVMDKGRRENEEFRIQVSAALAALAARKEESFRSTRHGLEFEQAVFAFLADGAQAAGDVVEHTAGTTGLIKNCKVGDVVLTLGPDHAAANSRIVVEAKQDASYGLARALSESEQARKNRQAEVGVFVFSKRTANAQIVPLGRYGNDVVLVWDCEDPATDVILSAGLSLARALCVSAGTEREQIDIDFERMQRAMLDVEKQVQAMEEIRKNAQSIRSCADKIEDRARIISDNLLRATRILDEETEAIRGMVTVES
jgi:hypothetical protein